MHQDTLILHSAGRPMDTDLLFPDLDDDREEDAEAWDNAGASAERDDLIEVA